MIRTRQAIKEDSLWIMEQLYYFAEFYDTKKKLFGQKSYALKYIESVIENHFVLVAENDDERTGFIAGLVMSHPFNPEIKMLQELWWWVAERFRGGRSGLKLFKDFSEFGQKYCDWTVFTLEEDSPVKDKILVKNGFKQKEVSYLRESTWQQ